MITLQNWKTTLSGVAAILTALADIAHSLSTGQQVNWNVDIAGIITGIGLIAAKDSTTHSTPAQVEASGAVVQAQTPEQLAAAKALKDAADAEAAKKL